MVFDGVGAPFRTVAREFDTAELLAGEALVRIDLATICGSDIHTIAGTRQERTPCVLGHEAVGRVVAVDKESTLTVGERLTWSIADSCGVCPACTVHGLPQKCERLFKYGHAPLEDGSGLNGCYASHLVLRRGTHAVRVAEDIPDAVAAPANCALATMVHAIEGIPEGVESVLIQGGGLLGLYGCALLAERGVDKIFCTEIDTGRFALIEAFGGRPVDARRAGSVVDEIRGAARGAARGPARGGVDAAHRPGPRSSSSRTRPGPAAPRARPCAAPCWSRAAGRIRR